MERLLLQVLTDYRSRIFRCRASRGDITGRRGPLKLNLDRSAKVRIIDREGTCCFFVWRKKFAFLFILNFFVLSFFFVNLACRFGFFRSDERSRRYLVEKSLRPLQRRRLYCDLAKSCFKRSTYQRVSRGIQGTGTISANTAPTSWVFPKI